MPVDFDAVRVEYDHWIRRYFYRFWACTPGTYAVAAWRRLTYDADDCAHLVGTARGEGFWQLERDPEFPEVGDLARSRKPE